MNDEDIRSFALEIGNLLGDNTLVYTNPDGNDDEGEEEDGYGEDAFNIFD